MVEGMSNLTNCIDRHLHAFSGGRTTILRRDYEALLAELTEAADGHLPFTAAVAATRSVGDGELVPISEVIDTLLDLRQIAAATLVEQC
jgi:hypothetical protein